MKNHNQYIGGIADCWYSGPAGDLWVEYKFIKVPVRDDTMIDLVGGKNPDLSHLQQDWLKSRHAEGRSVGVIVGSTNGGVWFPKIFWGKPISSIDFRAMIRSRSQLAGVIAKITMDR